MPSADEPVRRDPARIRADLRANADQLEAIGQPWRANRQREIANESDEQLAIREAQLEAAEEQMAEQAVEDAETPEGRAQAAREAEHRQRLDRGEIPVNAFTTSTEDRAELDIPSANTAYERRKREREAAHEGELEEIKGTMVAKESDERIAQVLKCDGARVYSDSGLVFLIEGSPAEAEYKRQLDEADEAGRQELLDRIRIECGEGSPTQRRYVQALFAPPRERRMRAHGGRVHRGRSRAPRRGPSPRRGSRRATGSGTRAGPGPGSDDDPPGEPPSRRTYELIPLRSKRSRSRAASCHAPAFTGRSG